MKKNGFMLAEVLIVSTLLIGTMTFMYVQLRTLTTNYNKSFKYNTVDGLYGARIIKDFLVNEPNYSSFNTTTFIEKNKINRIDLFNALINELGIDKIVISNNVNNVYAYLINNYDLSSSYNEKTEYYESLITFTAKLKDEGKHIIIAYTDGTFCDFKF